MQQSTRSQTEPTRCHTDWGLRGSPWDCRQPEGSRPQRSPPGLWSPAWYRGRLSVCVLHALLAPHRPTKQSRDMTLSGPDGSAVSALGLHGRSQIGLLCPAVHSPDQARPGSSRPARTKGWLMLWEGWLLLSQHQPPLTACSSKWGAGGR